MTIIPTSQPLLAIAYGTASVPEPSIVLVNVKIDPPTELKLDG